jgi:hypothetical protein
MLTPNPLSNKTSFIMQKFSVEEFANMPICNKLETIHNIWFQYFGKRNTWLYVVTFDDYA